MFDIGRQQIIAVIFSVVDPHHVEVDPDSTYHPDADPDSDFLFNADPDADACGNQIPYCSLQKGR
jgi:hypothetical protein